MCLKPSKREQNRLERRASIIDVATRSFLEQGYAATSMSTIAAELGGSKGTLWAHFGSKEELFAAVIDTLIEGDSAQLEAMLRNRRYSRESVRSFCRLLIALLMKPDAVRLYRLIVGEGERFPELRDMFYRSAPMRMKAMLPEFFAQQFDEDAAEEIATLILAAILGYRAKVLILPEPPSKADMDRFVDSLITRLNLP